MRAITAAAALIMSLIYLLGACYTHTILGLHLGVSLRCSALVCGAGMSTRRTTLSSLAGGAPRLTGGVTAPDKAILKGCLVREVWSRRPPRTLCFRSSALVHEAMQAGLAVTGMLWSGTRRPMAGDDLSRLSSKVTVPDRQF